jgi:16S rRNA (guanine1207-N2)-methyltransferase
LPRLTPDGTAWLVVSRNLGADSLHRWLSESFDRPVDRVASHKGFRVLMVGPTSGR